MKKKINVVRLCIWVVLHTHCFHSFCQMKLFFFLMKIMKRLCDLMNVMKGFLLYIEENITFHFYHQNIDYTRFIQLNFDFLLLYYFFLFIFSFYILFYVCWTYSIFIIKLRIDYHSKKYYSHWYPYYRGIPI